MAVARIDGQAVELSPQALADLDAASPGVPARVSRLQGRRALKAAGMLADVESYFAAMPADHDDRMTYEDASHWERGHPMIAALAGQFELSEGQVDALFAAAALIA